jgi:hypothetical protein
MEAMKVFIIHRQLEDTEPIIAVYEYLKDAQNHETEVGVVSHWYKYSDEEIYEGSIGSCSYFIQAYDVIPHEW